MQSPRSIDVENELDCVRAEADKAFGRVQANLTASSALQNAAINSNQFNLPNTSSNRLSSHPLMNGNIQPSNLQHELHQSRGQLSDSDEAEHKHHTMSRQPFLQSAAPLRNLQDSQVVIAQVQELNRGQLEQIMELRIRVAVLENELMHARRDKDAVSSSLGIVIESLARFHNNNPTSGASTERGAQSGGVGLSVSMGNSSMGGDMGGARIDVKGLEKEIDRLRRENRVLRKREKEMGYGVAVKSLLGEDEEHHVHFRPGTPIAASSGEKGESKERVLNGGGFKNSFQNGGGHGPTPEQLIGSWGNSDPSFHNSSNANGLTSKDLIGSWGNPSLGVGETGPSNFNNSFGSGSTTVPNTPVLNATSFDTSFADIGLHSLEENMEMDSNGFPPALSFPYSNPNPSSATPLAPAQYGMGEEKDIDAQLLDNQSALQKLNSLPKPSVLKVGFEVEGTKRGEDYDTHPLRAPPSYARQRSMRDYDHFGTNPPLSGSRALRSDSDLALKISADLSKDESLWEDEEREGAVEIHMRATSSRARDAETKFPDFFRYGISYRPSTSDSNYLRTVMLTNLPLETALRDVLARVRGGEVLSASLFDTRSITSSLSARIVFRQKVAAEEYVLYCSQHPLAFPSSSTSESDSSTLTPATVTILSTPTYPLNPRILGRLIFHAQTRCLSLPSFPPSSSLNELERQLSAGNGRRADMLVEMWIDEDGTLHLHFSDVLSADAAYRILTRVPAYRGLEVLFSDDPCAGPVEELSLPVEPRPPVLPKNWAGLQKRAMGGCANGDGDEVVKGGEGGERKRLAALSNQKVEIPSFSGRGLQGDSWADEVLEELEGECPASDLLQTTTSRVEMEVEIGGKEGAGVAAPPNSPTHGFAEMENGVVNGEGECDINAILVRNVNEMMLQGGEAWWKDEGLTKAPVGLAGSKYAPRVPSFEDVGERQRSGRHDSQNSNPLASAEHDLVNKTETTTAGATNAVCENGNAQSEEDNDSYSTFSSKEIANHRVQLPPSQTLVSLLPTNHNLNPKKLNKSPPKVSLHDLLASSPSASPPSSNPSSPPSNPHHHRKNKNLYEEANEMGGVARMPRGPEGGKAGFGGLGAGKGINGYDSEEAETDELNLRIPSEKLRLDALDSLSPVSEVLNPDEISLSLSDAEDSEDEKFELEKQARVEQMVAWELVSA